MQREQEIHLIIDDGLRWIYDLQIEYASGGGAQNALSFPPEMLEDYFPVDSLVTEAEIAELEAIIGHRLPEDYKTLLKYKHFLELGIGDAWFRNHDAQNWKSAILKKVSNGWPREDLIGRGYIPFADWQDLGLYCFDAHGYLQDFNYPVVRWDHEWPEEVKPVAEDFFAFLKLLKKMDGSSPGE